MKERIFFYSKTLINNYEKKIMIAYKATQKTVDSDEELVKIDTCVLISPGLP